jgi:phosphohistidine phosphatase
MERRLSATGRKQAKRAAAWLRRRLPRDAIVLSSPARRATETAEAMTDHYRVLPQLGTQASAGEVLAAAGWPHGKGTVVIVGHQPTLGRAAAMALTGFESDWRFGKGAIWWLERDGAAGGGGVALRAVVSPDLV